MPRRNPISPTVPPMYAERREPAASTSSTSPGGAASTDATNTTAPTYAAPKIAHASVCHTALRRRARATGPYQRSHAARRCVTRRAPMRVTRTSLPGGAVVATSNRCRARRLADAPRSSATRSTPGRQVDVSTVGRANAASSASAGWIDTSSATVTPSRRIQPPVVNSDMYMWSSTKTWLRSIARRSRYAGRSWCSIVATDACSHATCDSRAMVTWSRKRRCARSLITRRNHVAGADTPSPRAAAVTSPCLPPSRPSARSLNQRARSASGSAAASARPNDTLKSNGAAAYPRLSARHMAGTAGGRSSVEGIEGRSGLGVVAEPRRLQLEHRAIAAACRHQLLVRAELDHLAARQHADAIGVADGREAVRDQDRGRPTRGGEDAVEDLRLAAHVELRRRLVEQHQPGAESHRAQRARQRNEIGRASCRERVCYV